jgi:hypothetical protein
MQHEVWIKGVLCLVAVPVVLWADRAGRQHSPRRAGPLLVLTALIAAATYYNFGAFHGRGYVHYWEQFHYYLGSKYFPELGYDGLYAASLAAQRETRPEIEVQPWVRDLRTNEVVSAYRVLAHSPEVVARFSPGRWRHFTADHDHFLTHVGWGYLQDIRKDHGYNPTPAWTFVARLLDRALPASAENLALLGALDPLLLAVLFAFLFATYGSRVGCLCLVVFGLGYPWRFDWIGGAFLRMDWLVAIGIAVCLMRRERYRWAGALVAYASMVRIFPAVFLLGPGVLAVRALVRREDLRWAWRFAQGFLLSVVLCAAAGALAGRGVGAWSEFASNLEKHQGTWLTNNVGLENVVLYDVDTVTRKDVDWSLPEPWLRWQHKMDRLLAERRTGIYALAVLYLGVVAAASWRARRDESLVLGIGAVFALALLTCYYWAMLLLVPIRSDKHGAAVLLALSAALCAVHLATPPSFEMVYGVMSWALALLAWAWLGPDAVATPRDALRRMKRPSSASAEH